LLPAPRRGVPGSKSLLAELASEHKQRRSGIEAGSQLQDLSRLL